MRPELAVRPHVVYRFFDDTGALLYVGMTVDFDQRRLGHMTDKDWWAEVDESRTTFEAHHTRECCQMAEAVAIATEEPRHNSPSWKPKGYLLPDDLARLQEVTAQRDQARTEYKAEVLAIMAEGASFAEMSKATGLSTNTLQRWKRETGDESNA